MRRAAFALPRLVGVWLRAAPSAILAVLAVVALTAFLATAAPLWFVKSTQAALPALLGTVSAGRSGLEFEQAGQIQPPTTDGTAAADPLDAVAAAGAKLQAELPGSLVRIVEPQVDVIDGQELLAIDPPQRITSVTFRIEPAIGDAIHYYAGREPTGRIGVLVRPFRDQPEFDWPVYEIALSRTTAATLNVGLGDEFVLVPGKNQAAYVGAQVVGLFDVPDPNDPRWFGDSTLDMPGVQQLSQELFQYHAVGLLSPSVYPRLVGDPSESGLRYRWRFPLDLHALASVGIEQLTLDLAKLRAAHPFTGAGALDAPGLSTGLSPLLALYQSRLAVAETALALASVGAIVASAGALALVAAALARRRGRTIRLARARGADLRRLLAIQLAEAVALVVPAAVLGAIVAIAVLGGELGSASGAVVVGLGAALVLVASGLSAARSSLASGRQRTDRTVDARNRRRVLDALVVVVAVATAVGLRSGVTSDPAAPPDPYRAAAPALLAIAGAIVILRVYDLVVAGLARVARRGRGFVGVHAIRGLARGPRTHELPLLVLLVAVAAGVFSTSVATTIGRTQALAAATQVGADYRIEASHPGPLPPNLDMTALQAIGPTATASRDIGTLFGIGYAGQSVDVVALDAPGYAAVTAGTPIAAAYPPELIPATPADGTPAHPVPIIVAPGFASDTGLHTGSVVRLSIGTHTATVVVVGVGDPVPAIALSRGIVGPLDALRVAFPDRQFSATQAFVRGGPSARAAIQAVLQPYVAGLRLVARTDIEATLGATPLVDTMSRAFLIAQVIAALYAAVVVGAAAAQALATRSAELSLLRAIGLPGRRAVAVVVIELGSTVLVALAGGLGLGLATAWLVVPGLGIGQFVGVAAAAPTAIDPAGLALALLAPAVAGLVALVIAGRTLGSSGVADWIRSAET